MNTVQISASPRGGDRRRDAIVPPQPSAPRAPQTDKTVASARALDVTEIHARAAQRAGDVR